MPSICDWAGINVPGKRQGVSFRPIVENGSADKQHQPYIVTETSFAQTASTRGWMLRTSQYKYVLYDTGKNREQLYDMETDRGEMRNLAIEKKYADILRQIPAELLQNFVRGQLAFAVKACNLMGGVDPGIGAAGAGNLDGLPQDPAEGTLQFPLNGILYPGQPLPAPVTGAVVADIKPQIPHSLPFPSWPPARCRRKTKICPFDRTPEHGLQRSAW